MTRKQAQQITDTKFEVEKQWANAQNEHEQQVFWGWLKAIEPEYIKAQKVLSK